MTTMGVTTWSHAAAKVGYCSGIYPLRLLFDLAGRLQKRSFAERFAEKKC
jgi:hypothetical protein